ncbi:YceI family protein [Spartinivicinus ruber]|uniref:YceI family protein n=1 Tax=Spartinivicinus ruber TaxID=2683272 RepID=UPI0013D0AD8A|nr:YceI family protein [Spartinivicinus ruber]
MRLNKVASVFMGLTLLASSQLWAADYKIDTKGAHAFIQFRVKHLGYSWLYGRFNTFDGSFSYDEKKPEATKINVTIDTASIDSNHAERDKHLRSDDFLDVKKFPKATFVSKKVMPKGSDKAVLVGDLTLHGVTKEVSIDVTKIGGGKDPWGGYRQGFQGSTSFKLKDFNIKKDLGPASQEVELILSIEGIRQS